MGKLDDSRSLAQLSIPGSHDSAARVELYPGTSKCQSLTIEDQLAAGVRYFDLRLRDDHDKFALYHGIVDQQTSFDDVVAAMLAFLDAHPGETVIASVKQEVDPSGATTSFEDLFAAYVAKAPDRWYLAPAVPTLGQVRGKIVLLRRFEAASKPFGIDASRWDDNKTFSIINRDALLAIEDNYIVTDARAKWSCITHLLADAAAGDPSKLFLVYTSGYQLIHGLPDIPSVSDDIDSRLDTLLADQANAHARLGILVMDFVTAERVRAIISTNL